MQVWITPQSLNLYGYVNNNPLSNVDPDGHWPGVFSIIGWSNIVDGAVAEYQKQLQNDQSSSQQTQQNQQQAQQPSLPAKPSDLGPEWTDITPKGGTNPKIPKRFRGPKGTEIEFHPADPQKGPRTEGGNDHWHNVNPNTGKREDEHLAPGSPIPGPDGVPTPPPPSDPDSRTTKQPSDNTRTGCFWCMIL